MRTLILSLFLFPSIAFATPVHLTNGMSMSDVIKLKGPPKEKDEHEISRIIKWKYDGETLVFKNGLLSYRTVKNIELVKNSSSHKPIQMGKTEISQEVADDIIKSIPNDPSPASPSAPQQNQIANPGSPILLEEPE